MFHITSLSQILIRQTVFIVSETTAAATDLIVGSAGNRNLFVYTIDLDLIKSPPCCQSLRDKK